MQEAVLIWLRGSRVDIFVFLTDSVKGPEAFLTKNENAMISRDSLISDQS